MHVYVIKFCDLRNDILILEKVTNENLNILIIDKLAMKSFLRKGRIYPFYKHK